jgi:DNA damage-inducible protein 1
MNEKIDVTFVIQKAGAPEALTIPVKLNKDATTQDMQILIQSLAGIQPSSQRLLYNGSVLAPTLSLLAAGVSRHDLIQVLEVNSSRNVQQAVMPRPRVQPRSAGLGLQAPQMPQLYRMTPQQFTTRVHQMGFLPRLLQMDPELGNTVLTSDMVTLGRILSEKKAKVQKDIDEYYDLIRRAREDEFNPEIQMKLKEAIDKANVHQNYEIAMQEMPEAFGRVVMLYVPVEVSGHKTIAFIDSGAQMTIMSKPLAQKCGLLRLMDERWKGKAVGVGTAPILGRIHLTQLKFGSMYLQTSISILEDQKLDLIFGLDMLRRWQAVIDLKEQCLRIGNESIKFLQETDIPHLRQQNLHSAEMTVVHESVNGTNRPTANQRPTTERKEHMDIDEVKAPMQSVSSTAENPLPTARLVSVPDAISSNPRQLPSLPPPPLSTAETPVPQHANPSSALLESNQSNRPMPTFPENHIAQLVAMGFTRQRVIQILEATGGNVVQAANLLFES